MFRKCVPFANKLQASRVVCVRVFTIHSCISLYQFWKYFTIKIYVLIMTTTSPKLRDIIVSFTTSIMELLLLSLFIKGHFKFIIRWSKIEGHTIIFINKSKSSRIFIGHISLKLRKLIDIWLNKISKMTMYSLHIWHLHLQ